jgi:hypothetical protein
MIGVCEDRNFATIKFDSATTCRQDTPTGVQFRIALARTLPQTLRRRGWLRANPVLMEWGFALFSLFGRIF